MEVTEFHDFASEEQPAFFGYHGWHQIFVAGEAEVFGIDAVAEDFEPEAAFVLEAAEFVHGAFEDAVGFGASAVHGGDMIGFGRGVLDLGAAAEAPGGPGDFGGEGLFQCSFGGEVLPHAGG